ncbi:MAG: hypothetical protein AAGC80_06010 [Rhodococcus sp. (in: high G+C Gram-positive bacteria)]
MNTFALRTAVTSAAIATAFALGSGVAAAAPAFHGDPNTPGTQLHVHTDPSTPADNNSYQCGAIGVGGAGVGSKPSGGSGQLNGVFFGSGPVQGGCIGNDGSVHFPSGRAE